MSIRDVHGNGKYRESGIPFVPWDSHGNGNTISHRMGMVLRCVGNGNQDVGVVKKSLHTVTSKHLQKALIAYKFISTILLGNLSLQLTLSYLGAVNSFDRYIICFL